MLLLLAGYSSLCQKLPIIDTLEKKVIAAKNDFEKVQAMGELSAMLLNVNPAASDSVGEDLIIFAEATRSRQLMAMAYLENGRRTGYLAARKDYADRSVKYYEKALKIAQSSRLDAEIVKAYIGLTDTYIGMIEPEKVYRNATEALSMASSSRNDSLRSAALICMGKAQVFKNEKIFALRNYFAALAIAEKQKDDGLLIDCYTRLGKFYGSIEEFDKGIDYLTLAFNIAKKSTNPLYAFQVVNLNSEIAAMYGARKSHDMAIRFYENSIVLAAPLQYPSINIPAYMGLLNQYLSMKQPQRALTYLRSPQGQEITGFLKMFRLEYSTHQALAFIFSELNQFDSAKYYFEKARPFFEAQLNPLAQINLYLQMGDMYKRTGEHNTGIMYLEKALALGTKAESLKAVEIAAQQLDTLYTRTGNFKEAARYSAMYFMYKDSANTLDREKELVQIEVDAEQQKLQRLQEEAAEKTRQRNNLQYLAITIGIVSLFIGLILLGMFNVSRGVVRALGFFVFLMFFEFIFLLFKKNIYGITKGEPWKDLAMMIALAAILVPLHHWLEHKVLHYLTSHNKLSATGQALRQKWLGKEKPGAEG